MSGLNLAEVKHEKPSTERKKMTASYSPMPCTKLFEPLQINGMRLKNRIVMPAMHLNYTLQGEVTDQLIASFKEAPKKLAVL